MLHFKNGETIMQTWLKKIIPSTLVISLTILLFCWIVLFIGSRQFWSGVNANSFVTILNRLGVIFYNPSIGGHQAHFSDVIWIVAFILSILNGAMSGYLVKTHSSNGYIVTWLGIAILSSIVFYISLWTFFSFLQGFERFAYGYFFPPS
jgi:hypothetical protein